MSAIILVLLIGSALGHAIWNALSKQVEEKDAFFTVINGIAVVVYFPVAMYLYRSHPIPAIAAFGMFGSLICELIYFYGLAKAYKQLPLSYAYPIVRGLSPLVSTILSFFLGTAITILGFLGIFIIITGIFIMQVSGKLQVEPGSRWAFLAGIANGVAITFDSWGASLMSGVLFKYVVFIGIFIGKVWMDSRQDIKWGSYKRLLKLYPGKAIIGGILTFGVNAIAQYALQTTPVGYVSATRELSIAFGVLIGWLFFREKLSLKRVLGILAVVFGVIIIKLGG